MPPNPGVVPMQPNPEQHLGEDEEADDGSESGKKYGKKASRGASPEKVWGLEAILHSKRGSSESLEAVNKLRVRC